MKEWRPKIDEAKARLSFWKIPELRHICVEGLLAGGWIRFWHDRDGYLEVESMSENMQYIEEKTGKPVPPFWETNAAWEIAYENTPKSEAHKSNTEPVGTKLRRPRWIDHHRGTVDGDCEVTGYSGSWQLVRFEDGDERAIKLPVPNEHDRLERKR